MSLNIQVSKDGYRILQVEEQGKVQYIGSRYCQKREIDKFISECLSKEYNSIYFVFGLGFGEHIQELLKHISPDTKLLIVELNKELVRFCKNDDSIRKILSDKRVYIASDCADLKKFMDENIDEINIADTKLIYYCRYDRIYADKLQEVYSELRSETERITTNRNTILHFCEEWTECMINNLRYIAKGMPVNELKGKYKDVPAVIVSAGPSLEKNIDELKEFQEGIVISGGRTLKPLMEKSIEPDLLCVMDSDEVSYKLVKDYLDSVKCPLVFSENSNSDVVREHNGKKIFSANNEFISEVCGKHIQTLSGGGSVAHSMTLLASYMGCNPIIFIGQDLAYTGEKGHASSAKNTWQNMTFDDYKRTDDIYVEDINGEPVRTSLVLNRYRISLQNIIKMFPNITYINATEGGANIEGTENRKLAEVIEVIKGYKVQKDDIHEEDYSQKVISMLKETLENISAFEKLYEIRKDTISNMVNTDYEKLHEIDDKIKKTINKVKVLDSVIIKCRYDAENNADYKIFYEDSDSDKRRKSILKDSYLYDMVLKNMQNMTNQILKDYKKI